MNNIVVVPLSTFLTFNKIKILLNSIAEEKREEMIVKSISKSEKLELNNEGKSVQLKGELVKRDQNEIDECTIYVEQIPLNSDHETMQSVFSKYGHINYISLPRYKQSRQLKQFGYIEFGEKDCVQKCIDDFKKFDGVLHCSKPEKLLSISTFEIKPKTEGVEEAKNDEEEKKEVKEEDKKDEDMKSSTEDQQPERDEQTDKEPKKKNRKHKRKNKKQKTMDERAVTMRIMRKTLWKKLRNEYLNLERQKAKEIKKILQETRKANPKEQLVKLSPVSPRISFYKSPSNRDPDAHDSVSEEQHDAGNTGPIVNIKFREPCNDLKELRQEFRQFSYVHHVEIVESGAQCNVRVAAQSYAQELVSLYSGCEYEANIISGDIEKEYWKRISENKERNKCKTENNPNRKQRRGREKLAKMIIKASTQHIRFNDNMEVTESI